MNDKYGIGASEVMGELEKLKQEGVVTWPSKRNKAAAPVTLIRSALPAELRQIERNGEDG